MAEQNDAQEKTEQPSAKRLREAREKGQVARSMDLNTFLSMLFGAVGLLLMGETLVENFFALSRDLLTFDRATAFASDAPVSVLGESIGTAIYNLLPYLGLMLLSAFVGPLLMGGWNFSMESISFKLDKLNPLSGLKRIFSANSLMELVKSLAKFFVLLGAAWFVFRLFFDQLLSLGSGEYQAAVVNAAEVLLWGFLLLGMSLLLVAAVDVPFKLWDHTRKLKMSRQEVKDEHKETEGRPEVKAKIRALQRQAAQQRMMLDVPTADVVITNPTHFAVALSYKKDGRGAPIVVAKGRDLVAARIRSVAEENGVTIYSEPPLARALFRHVEIGGEIPAKLYMAVAIVLAYVYRLNEPGAGVVQEPDAVEIPEEYRVDSED
jgi:flagellar biosynthetic protein FlhB